MTRLRITLLGAGYGDQKDFFCTDTIIYTKKGKDYLHTFNYLNQEITDDGYLELSDLCLQFNEKFQNEEESNVTEEQKLRLSSNWFFEVIDHQFDNQQLEMDFYPAIKGFYVKDKENSHYMLLGIQKYDSQNFSGLKLLKYSQPAFTFPHKDNYIK